MAITEILPGVSDTDSRNLKVSFEFFPPKSDKMAEQLWQAVDRLAPLKPGFVSVTYGAGGSTRERTHAIVTSIQEKTGIPAAAHLTCVAATRAEIDTVADGYWNAGIRHIVAPGAAILPAALAVPMHPSRRDTPTPPTS